MRTLPVVVSCALLACFLVSAQDNQNRPKQGTDSEVQAGHWTGNFAGGQIMIPISKIAAVAQQKYVLDGQFMVYEVTIDVTGSTVTRIYYIEPLVSSATGVSAVGEAVINRGRELSDMARGRVGAGDLDPETVVTKNYPTTTHAHTIEYRVRTLEELNAAYKSVTTAFQRNRGRIYTANK